MSELGLNGYIDWKENLMEKVNMKRRRVKKRKKASQSWEKEKKLKAK